MDRRKILLYSLKKSVPVMLGYGFIGTAFGILLQRSGLNWPWALFMSVTVYAGSMQFALVPLLESGASYAMIAVMTLLVNSRHLFYGLTFIEPYRELGVWRPYAIFSLTDETYSVLCSCKGDECYEAEHHAAAVWISLLHQSYWVAGSVLGAVLGEKLALDTFGIDFSMTALFIIILVEQLQGGGRDAAVCAGLGLLFGGVFLVLLGPSSFLLPTLFTTVTALIAADLAGLSGGKAHD